MKKTISNDHSVTDMAYLFGLKFRKVTTLIFLNKLYQEELLV